MKKVISIIIFTLLILLTTGCLQQAEEKNVVETPEFNNDADEIVNNKAGIIINSGADVNEVEVEIGGKATAYDLLKEAAKELGLEIKTTEYDFGISVDAIGENAGGTDNKYWMFYVNDQMAPVAADKQEIKVGDRVEFKFEESSF